MAEGPLESLRIAVAQVEVCLADIEGNIARCLAALNAAAAAKARLVVLPECVLTGYVFENWEVAAATAVRLDGGAVERLRERCARLGIFCVAGLLEDGGASLHNTAILIDETGKVVGSYRKAHLPFLGVDRFVAAGSAPPPVFDTAIGRIGINICYDIRFPEAARIPALAGADVIALPATWPLPAKSLAEHFTIVRAAENRVVLAVANRGDSENGMGFVGMSQIVTADGRVIARATREPTVLAAEVRLSESRSKRTVRIPGSYETDVVDDRRPELYGALGQAVIEQKQR